METQANVYEERIFDARSRFLPGAPASRYQVGWMDALNYVLVGELPETSDNETDVPACFQVIVQALERLEGHYTADQQWSNAGRMKGLRISVQKMAASVGIDVSGPI